VTILKEILVSNTYPEDFEYVKLVVLLKKMVNPKNSEDGTCVREALYCLATLTSRYSKYLEYCEEVLEFMKDLFTSDADLRENLV